MTFTLGFILGMAVMGVSAYRIAPRAIDSALRRSFATATEAVARHHREVDALVRKALGGRQ